MTLSENSTVAEMDALLKAAGLSREWADTFIRESNQIDPQPGSNSPGDPVYERHMLALQYVLRVSVEDRYALPKEIHSLLTQDGRGGVWRQHKLKLNGVEVVAPNRIPFFMWRWNRDVWQTLDNLRVDDGSVSVEARESDVWGLHYELVNIRPFDAFNGKVGRLLMVNHAMLVDLRPWIIPFSSRQEYLQKIRAHHSHGWGSKYDEENALPLTVGEGHGKNAQLPR